MLVLPIGQKANSTGCQAQVNPHFIQFFIGFVQVAKCSYPQR